MLTNTSKLLPVRYQNMPAMLKIALIPEEIRGGQLMVWWNGRGAAGILAHEDDVILMERATGDKSLARMAKHHQDDEASRIICSVAAKLHDMKPSHNPLFPSLVPLSIWFKALDAIAAQHGGILSQAATLAKELLNNPQDISVLHGDLHHENILDFGEHGWLAIDPKGLLGERGFDFANIFCNPDLDMAIRPGRLEQQAVVVAEAAGLEHLRLMQWIAAYAGLSAAWHLEDGSDPGLAMAVAGMALSALNF